MVYRSTRDMKRWDMATGKWVDARGRWLPGSLAAAPYNGSEETAGFCTQALQLLVRAAVPLLYGGVLAGGGTNERAGVSVDVGGLMARRQEGVTANLLAAARAVVRAAGEGQGAAYGVRAGGALPPLRDLVDSLHQAYTTTLRQVRIEVTDSEDCKTHLVIQALSEVMADCAAALELAGDLRASLQVRVELCVLHMRRSELPSDLFSGLLRAARKAGPTGIDSLVAAASTMAPLLPSQNPSPPAKWHCGPKQSAHNLKYLSSLAEALYR
ncbi:hypothetical protein CYMTET_56615 [Cymbomonas tetramitiformis]|uniref:Uncharacterized protein n=1 Tax=Cymbomonas tetramitiformis TaxID=36881 RepID=A0AAE0BC24_9CHLO|nr:hypothetical protein CYMTET_56615 [Cymbomonas tetramitiformis]